IPPAEFSPPAEIVTTFVQLVYRQFPVISLVTALCFLLGVVYLLITPASYTALATMIIDTKRPTVFTATTSVGDIAAESAIVSSQVEILKSEKIALSVINNLELWNDSEFVGPGKGLVAAMLGLFNSFAGNELSATREARTRQALDQFQNY